MPNRVLTKKVKLLVVDDHPLFRQGMLHILKKSPLIEQIDEADDGEVALQKITEQVDYDMVLLDISMPKIDGLKVLDYIHQILPKCRVVMVTSYNDEEYLKRAFDCGARGFILKEDVGDNLDSCIATIYRGKKYISPSVKKTSTENILDYSITADYDLSVLTKIEQKVLHLTMQFKTKKEIAMKLRSTPEMIEKRRQKICQKLNLKSIHQLSHLKDIFFPK